MKIFIFVALLFLNNTLNAQKQDVKNKVNKIAAIEKGKMKNTIPYTHASHNYNVTWQGIYVKVNPAIRKIDAHVMINFLALTDVKEIVLDLTHTLKIDSVIYKNKKISYKHDTNNALKLIFPNLINKETSDAVIIYYHGEPSKNKVADTKEKYSFIIKKHNGIPEMFTVNQPYGAYTWMPCKNGLDDKIDSVDFYITHPTKYKATANGLLVSEIKNETNTTTHYKHRYAVASYLLAFAVTNYVVIKDSVSIDGNSLTIITHAYPEDETTFKQNIDSIKYSLQLFSKVFGIYPYMKELYGQTQAVGSGGIEHQTNSFVDVPDIGLMNHELAHQWFGNKITCASWSDIWLNEGSAEYIEAMLYPKLSGNIKLYKENIIGMKEYVTSKTNGSVWIKDITKVENIFDSRLAYCKGAFVHRMLQYTLGDSIFFKGLYNYINDPLLIYNFATTSDYRKHMEQVSGIDLKYFFDQWVYGEGYPTINLGWKQDYISKKISCTITQKSSHSSVLFYKMQLPFLVKGIGQQKFVTIDFNENNQLAIMDNIDFDVTEIIIDPDAWLITKNNSVKKILK